MAEPVDLDALLSPAGSYESGPDAAMADGSQLVRDQHGNPTWWAPLHGCDSLDGLLFRIRSRILPHLRPPVIGIDIPGPDGDWGNIVDLCQAEGVEVEAGARLLRRARAAWGQGRFTPPAPDESAEHIRDATEMVAPPADGADGPSIEQLGILIAWLTEQCCQASDAGRSVDAGMLLWAAQVAGERVDEDAQDSTPPAEGEAGGLVADLKVAAASYFNRGFSTDARRCRRAADLLQQQAAELAMLRQLAEEILALVSESDGVAGLHLNGDLAPWDELLPGGRFERLTSLPLEDHPNG